MSTAGVCPLVGQKGPGLRPRLLIRGRRRERGNHEMDTSSDCFYCLGDFDLVDTGSDFLVYSIGRPNERQRKLLRRGVYWGRDDLSMAKSSGAGRDSPWDTQAA